MKQTFSVITEAKFNRVKALDPVELKMRLPTWLRARFGMPFICIGVILMRDDYIFLHVDNPDGDDWYFRAMHDKRFIFWTPKGTETRLRLDWDIILQDMKIHEFTDYRKTDEYKCQLAKYKTVWSKSVNEDHPDMLR